MQNLLNDFKIFYSTIFDCIKDFYNWFSGTIIGEIFIFLILISLFFVLISLFIDFKN